MGARSSARTSTPTRAVLAGPRRCTADDQGLEILVYDEHDELVGALVATPGGDRIRIEADFDDGYATIELSPDESDVLQTDLEQTAAVGRVAEMIAFSVPSTEPLAATRAGCMWAFAAIATMCGGGALFPPASAALVGGCLGGLGKALCECGEYLPVDICP